MSRKSDSENTLSTFFGLDSLDGVFITPVADGVHVSFYVKYPDLNVDSMMELATSEMHMNDAKISHSDFYEREIKKVQRLKHSVNTGKE